MKLAHPRRFAVLISLISLLLVSVVLFFTLTSGRTVCRDGVMQNTRVYLDNVYYEDGTVYYTVVNKTYHRVMISQKPEVEKWVDGEWVSSSLWKTMQFIALSTPAFSRSERSFATDNPPRELTGRYRLTFGSSGVKQGEDGTHRRVFREDTTFIVGYLTIE